MKTILKDICDFYSGTGFPVAYQGKKQGKYPFFKVGDISKNVQNGQVYLTECDNYIDDQEVSIINGTLIPQGTIVFAKIGEALKLNRRAITSQWCLVDNNAIAVKPNTEIVDIDYFYFFMKRIDMAEYSSSTTVPSVKKSSLEKIAISLPSLSEQYTISKELSALSNAINAKKQQIQILNELVKSRFILQEVA